MEIRVENIKCGGCMNTITKELLSIDGTSNILIDNENQIINLDASEELRPTILQMLHKLGYPEVGHNNIIEKAKSYMSCAVGRMTK
jgi:copper chaperone